MVLDEHRMQSCLDALYGTLTNPALWPEAIGLMKSLTGAASATFALIGDENKNKIMGDELDDALKTEWQDYYCHLDPRRVIAKSSVVGAWITDDRLLDPHRSPSLEYVNDFARRAGLRWSRGGKIYEGKKGFATLALHRPPNVKPFDDHLVLAVLDYLLPHVQRVATLMLDVNGTSPYAGTGIAITDLLDLPILIVSRECKLAYMNVAAEKLLISQQWISNNNKLLQIKDSTIEQAVLSKAVEKACALSGREASVIRVHSRKFSHFFIMACAALPMKIMRPPLR